MGRAQVVQAQAAGCETSVDMNPILLKPSSDVGSQVIVRGVPIGTMPAKEYFKYKKQLIPEIKKAFQHLSEQYDIIVIEGAGSPVEINLKSDVIVNMGMARMAGAPVLLAAEFVDDKPLYHRLFIRFQKRYRSIELCKHAAPVDVPGKQYWRTRHARHSHVHDIIRF